MVRTVATLPAGARITDYISLGVIAKTFPLPTVCLVQLPRRNRPGPLRNSTIWRRDNPDSRAAPGESGGRSVLRLRED